MLLFIIHNYTISKVYIWHLYSVYLMKKIVSAAIDEGFSLSNSKSCFSCWTSPASISTGQCQLSYWSSAALLYSLMKDFTIMIFKLWACTFICIYFLKTFNVSPYFFYQWYEISNSCSCAHYKMRNHENIVKVLCEFSVSVIIVNSWISHTQGGPMGLN